MYQYDDYDQAIVQQRTDEFRQQVEKRIRGEISEDEFKPVRLMNGLYLQLHAYMLRVAIPYGVLSSAQLRTLSVVADRYDRGYGHFTTRQNIQFNWPKLVETPDILQELASTQLHAIQTSGNCIRNITTDPFAGIADDESVDPRPVCELLRQWSTLHPEFAYLPRKFKFAITGSANDRAAIKVHDIGIQLKRSISGKVLVDLWLGGGQGRTPKVAHLFKSDLTVRSLLPYLEAVMRVYNQYGRRDNKYKSRIKILLAETGLEALQSMVEEELAFVDLEQFTCVEDELIRIEGRFQKPDYYSESTASSLVDSAAFPESDIKPEERREYQKWRRNVTRGHRVNGYRIVLVSLKPHGEVPGNVSSEQMRKLADLSERYSHGELRVTHRQNLVLPHVHERFLYSVWKSLQNVELATANIDMPSDIIACPGMDYCALATARSIPIAQTVSNRMIQTEKRRSQDIGQLSVNISGCINACAHHHVADIGILGLDRAGVENYQITLGGRNDANARVGQRMGKGVSADEVPEVVERLVNLYLDRKHGQESFSDTFDRIGKTVFSAAIHDHAGHDEPTQSGDANASA